MKITKKIIISVSSALIVLGLMFIPISSNKVDVICGVAPPCTDVVDNQYGFPMTQRSISTPFGDQKLTFRLIMNAGDSVTSRNQLFIVGTLFNLAFYWAALFIGTTAVSAVWRESGKAQ